MMRISVTARMSIGLVLLTVSICIAAQILGLMPDPNEEALDRRKRLSEIVGISCSASAQGDQLDAILPALETVVQRNPEILSIGVRRGGELLVKTSHHDAHWQGAPVAASSTTHVRVPIYRGHKLWGDTELVFSPLNPKGLFARLWSNDIFRLILFIGLAGYFAYRFYLKRTLRALDPSSVIPPRVKATLDALAEGVILIDKNEHIIMANAAFTKMSGLDLDALMGMKASELSWASPAPSTSEKPFPWRRSLDNAANQTGIRVSLSGPDGTIQSLIANTVPILDVNRKCRGALATFDDVTMVEAQNLKLQRLNKALEISNEKVRRQNQKLTILATHDPLTGCFNRRAFFGQLDAAFSAALRHGHELSCVMIDADHFKSINDRFGHAAGDYVLEKLAGILQSGLRTEDKICRYGGEEFCLLLPHTDIKGATKLADRLREKIEAHDFRGIQVTVSMGVADINSDSAKGDEMVAQADKALYAAKADGRNKVVPWNDLDVGAA